MEFTHTRTVKVTAYLLLVLAATQALYTIMHIAKVDVPRQLLWGLEGVLFTVLVAFAGAAMVQAKSQHVGWAAVAFSAVLNTVQVSIGLTMFGPFREAASQNESLGVVAGAVVALSFMIYFAAKLLLGLAALIFGLASLNAGNKKLGGLTAFVGAVAMFSNGILVMFGRDGFLPSPVAGGSGVLATLLLALCLVSLARKNKQA